VVRTWPVFLLALILAGCAGLPESPEAGPEPGSFELTARVAVRFGSEAASGHISWRHGAAEDDLFLTSPIGQGIARITRRSGLVELSTASGKTLRAADAESLTAQVLGWRLPLAGLADWVQGRPDPSRPSELERDRMSRLVEIRQDGWRVEFQEFASGRPSRLRLSREDLEIRLAVDQWQAR
jgi:outer membrane lipoprotein LolB